MTSQHSLRLEPNRARAVLLLGVYAPGVLAGWAKRSPKDVLDFNWDRGSGYRGPQGFRFCFRAIEPADVLGMIVCGKPDRRDAIAETNGKSGWRYKPEASVSGAGNWKLR